MSHFIYIQDPDHHGKGTSDGVFQNHPYFTCQNDCALFVSLEKLWSFEPKSVGMQGELQSQQLASRQQSVNKQPTYADVTSPSHGHKKPPPPTYPVSSEVDPPRMRFRIDDHVVIFDRNNTPLHGTVRWIGRKNQMGRDMGELHVGVEMVTRKANYCRCWCYSCACTRDNKWGRWTVKIKHTCVSLLWCLYKSSYSKHCGG